MSMRSTTLAIDIISRPRPLPRRLQQFQREPEITLVQETEDRQVRLRVRSIDRPGLLSLIARAMADLEVRLLQAKITTIGAEVDDLFTIADKNGLPLDDPERLEALVKRLRQQLSR